jgi:lauroyl/myristoyl acyltransferase
LRKGGVAALAVDGSQGTKDVAVPFLGRQFQVSRGVAVLARLTGAPIIPCVMTWAGTDWSMNFRIFDPLPLPSLDSTTPAAFEQAVLEAAVQRFEELARTLPGQLRVDQLARVASTPKI